MTTIQDAIKYGWVDQLAKDFFYEKCNGHPEDIIESIEKLVTDVVEAEKALAEEREFLANIPF